MRRSIEMRIKIRHRSPSSEPWKWELYAGKRLITASHESYASQDEAHAAGRNAADRILLEFAHSRNKQCGLRAS
jgi:hypothetical protein